MTAKSLVLHIGDPKTGSSSIQEVLRNRLYETDIVQVDYPDQLNSFPLANALWDKKQMVHRDARWARLGEWLKASTADVAIVSAEQFFRVDPEVLLQTLNDFVPELAGSVRIVAYVRPHANRLLSAYMQRTKAGLFQGDMKTFFERSKKEDLLSYSARFQHWRDTFGQRFTLRPMIRDQLRDGDVVTDFLDYALKGQAFRLRGTVAANTSLSLECLAGLREVQAVLRRNEIAIGTRHSVGDHVGRSLAGPSTSKGTTLQLPQGLYDEVKAFCAEDAAALDAAFFDKPLMTSALAQAGQDAVSDRQILLAKDCYSDETLQALRKTGRQLVTLFKKRPVAWTVAFERDIGQRPLPEDKAPPAPPVLAHIEKVDALLADLARLVAMPLTDAAQPAPQP